MAAGSTERSSVPDVVARQGSISRTPQAPRLRARRVAPPHSPPARSGPHTNRCRQGGPWPSTRSRETRTVKTVSPVHPYRVMSADKRIPVTEETRKELHELKEPGETYDDLLKQLARQRRRQDLEHRFQELEEADRNELTPLSDV